MQRKRLLQSCARTFNSKPKRGVEALKATGLDDLRAYLARRRGDADGDRDLRPSGQRGHQCEADGEGGALEC